MSMCKETHDESHVTTDPSLYVPQTSGSERSVLQLTSVPQSVCKMQATLESMSGGDEDQQDKSNSPYLAEVYALRLFRELRPTKSRRP